MGLISPLPRRLTEPPHPKLPGTIHTAAAEIEAAGGHALPLCVDIRYEEQVYAAVEQTVQRFGGIDILVNNASAISLTGTLQTPIKRFDLMMGVNTRGSCSLFAGMPAASPQRPPIRAHPDVCLPPLDMRAKWFAPCLAYTMAKFGMSMCVLGMAEEFRGQGIAVNALWPRTIIATVALQIIPGAEADRGRTPEIMADAAWQILTQDSRSTTGNFFIDEDVLAAAGVTDFARYAVSPGKPLRGDFFLD